MASNECTLAEEGVSFPAEPADGVLLFSKTFGESSYEYTYAAIKAADGLWYLTGARSPQGLEWEQLMVWLHDTGPMPELRHADTASFEALQPGST